jgi:peptidoglycan hydrolase-like protein with peptidoglycan-binding domain
MLLLLAPIDGDFGPMTKAAVIAFQKKSNLAPDGVVGLKSWAILQA